MSNHNAARRTANRPSFSFAAPTQQQNTRNGSLFVFGDSTAVEVETSDYEGIEMPVLSHRKGNKATTPDFCDQKSKSVFISRDLAPTDTLASLSLQYGCPIAEIKRANNIYSEQDFHGRLQLRIPVPLNSVMTDPEEQAKMQPAPGTRFKDLVNGTEDLPDHGQMDAEEIARSSSHKAALDAEKLLQRLDADLSSVKQQIDDDDGVLHDEHSQLLSRVAPDPDALEEVLSSQSTAIKEMESAMLCGFTWRHMVVIGIVAVLLPILCAFYYFEVYLT